MTKTKKQLLNTWFNVWNIGSWLRLLEMSKDYDQEDIKILEEIDQEAIRVSKEGEYYYRENLIPKIKSEIDSFINEFSETFRKEKRLEFLNPRITRLVKYIAGIWERQEKLLKRDVPHWFRSAILEFHDMNKLEKNLRSLTVQKYIIENPEALKRMDRISPEEIARAVSFPFDQLVQFNKAGFAACPFHKEKTGSLHWIKETNRAYCFGCQWKGDVIQFLRDKNSLSFKEAVRSLCR